MEQTWHLLQLVVELVARMLAGLVGVGARLVFARTLVVLDVFRVLHVVDGVGGNGLGVLQVRVVDGLGVLRVLVVMVGWGLVVMA